MSSRPWLVPSLLIVFIGLFAVLRNDGTVPRIFGGLAILGGVMILVAAEMGSRRR